MLTVGIVLQHYILVQTFHRFFVVLYCMFVLKFLLKFSIITFVVEHHVHPMASQNQESHVNIPASLEPVVVLVDGVGLHLHVELLILQLRDVMNCLPEIIRISDNCVLENTPYPPYLDWLVNLVVNHEIIFLEHHIPLHHQVGQLAGHIELSHRNGGLK